MDQEAPPFPSRVGRYRVLGPLGVGGMASVYLAVAEGAAGFSREVALKVLHPHLLSDPHLVAQFLTEARIAAKIRHPNVVPVTDVEQDRSWAYLVMDFVEGASLAELRRAARPLGGIPPRIWGRWLADALSGLHAAHELTDERGEPLGLVHRDFSPQNILVGRDGSARLSDFGVVKVTSGDQRTASGIVKGKVNYMSPEQVRGEALDRRCDVWAAGVVAWELVTGRRLRRHKDDVQSLLEIVSGDPPRASSLVPDVDPALDELIANALTTDLERRCPSAAALRARLLAALGGSLADIHECAEWADRAAAELLESRKNKLRAARSLRDQLDSLFDASGIETTTPLSSEGLTQRHESADAIDPPTELLPSMAPDGPAPRSSSRRGVVAGGLGVLALIALVVGFSALRPSPTRETVASTVPSPDEPPAPAATAILPKLPARLVLEANLPIAALAIDGRNVKLDQPGTRVELELPAFAVGRSELKLDARTATGETSSVLWSGGTAAFRFETRPLARQAKKSGAPPRASASGKTPLAKNPYAK
jgi:serine/threonine-protein kinase